ncbi:MptD family putative ECF transporter S component, partial [Streptococcus suis]
MFSFGNLGPIFLMWFMRDAYIQKLLERGKDMAYVKEVMVDFTLGNVLYLAGFIVICALIGGWLGQRLT